MKIQDAQLEVRSVFLGGSVGQAVSATIWLVSSSLATWVEPKYGIYCLIIVGMFIFPLTQLALKIMGRKNTLSKENPYTALSMQVAFIVPLLIPVILGATAYELNWFYPAFMMVVGAHYLPFMTLYGMRLFGFLGGILLAAGFLLGYLWPVSFALGGWITAGVLYLFAVLLGLAVKKENLW